MQEPENIEAEIEGLLKPRPGLGLVELAVLSRKGSAVNARAVVYSPLGTGTKECSVAHRLIYPLGSSWVLG